jgi:UDP-N-acetylglucosamine/UDP-N-acetylgalactosamine diphosphorylase
MSKIDQLRRKGVRIDHPAQVDIGPEVEVDRISGDGVVIYGGCKIFGSSTHILADVKLGHEGPVTVEDCRIGRGVELKGGYFQRSVFLEKASCGLGSHVREGTILEEQASIAHTVGLKHTILFPFVTLGSLVNFCDCLMAGGTSRQNHSEVGSSYIHFNFTPNQDKATASLIGDVPAGVMLDRPPIFLGGQGGLVGPCRLTYGLTVAAGCIVRKDELRPNRLIFGMGGKSGNMAFTPGKYTSGQRIFRNNAHYLGNLFALRQWYQQVRSIFVSAAFPESFLTGLVDTVSLGIAERINRLEAYCRAGQGAGGHQPEFDCRWGPLARFFDELYLHQGDTELREAFLENIQVASSHAGRDYIAAVQSLGQEEARAGSAWLQSIVDAAVSGVMERIAVSFPRAS